MRKKDMEAQTKRERRRDFTRVGRHDAPVATETTGILIDPTTRLD